MVLYAAPRLSPRQVRTAQNVVAVPVGSLAYTSTDAGDALRSWAAPRLAFDRKSLRVAEAREGGAHHKHGQGGGLTLPAADAEGGRRGFIASPSSAEAAIGTGGGRTDASTDPLVGLPAVVSRTGAARLMSADHDLIPTADTQARLAFDRLERPQILMVSGRYARQSERGDSCGRGISCALRIGMKASAHL